MVLVGMYFPMLYMSSTPLSTAAMLFHIGPVC